jgi:hypothetical protein
MILFKKNNKKAEIMSGSHRDDLRFKIGCSESCSPRIYDNQTTFEQVLCAKNYFHLKFGRLSHLFFNLLKSQE